MRLTWTRMVSVVLMATLFAPVQGSAAPAVAHRPCVRGSLVFSSWRIPGTNGRSGWRPLAVDGNRVVMVEGPGDMVARPGPLTMALVTAGSARYRSIPSGAYPHAGVLQRWQLSWPWLVGVFNLQSTPTLGWTLWAGNLQTGTHIVLDRGHEVGKSGTMHAFPDFDPSDGKVAWTWTSSSCTATTPTVAGRSSWSISPPVSAGITHSGGRTFALGCFSAGPRPSSPSATVSSPGTVALPILSPGAQPPCPWAKSSGPEATRWWCSRSSTQARHPTGSCASHPGVAHDEVSAHPAVETSCQTGAQKCLQEISPT